MVTASVVEDQSVSPAAAGVNWNTLIQRFLEGQGYKRILHQSTFLNFAWLLKFEGYYVCDLMIVGFAEDVEGAEAIVPRLDMECARIRRALLRGRPFQWGTRSRSTTSSRSTNPSFSTRTNVMACPWDS